MVNAEINSLNIDGLHCIAKRWTAEMKVTTVDYHRKEKRRNCYRNCNFQQCLQAVCSGQKVTGHGFLYSYIRRLTEKFYLH